MWISNSIYEEETTYEGRGSKSIAGKQEERRGRNIGNFIVDGMVLHGWAAHDSVMFHFVRLWTWQITIIEKGKPI